MVFPLLFLFPVNSKVFFSPFPLLKGKVDTFIMKNLSCIYISFFNEESVGLQINSHVFFYFLFFKLDARILRMKTV